MMSYYKILSKDESVETFGGCPSHDDEDTDDSGTGGNWGPPDTGDSGFGPPNTDDSSWPSPPLSENDGWNYGVAKSVFIEYISEANSFDNLDFRKEFEENVNEFFYGAIVNNSINYLRRARRLKMLNFRYMDSAFNASIKYSYEDTGKKSDYDVIEMDIELDTISTSVVYLFTSYLNSDGFTESIDNMITREYGSVLTVKNVTGTQVTVTDFSEMNSDDSIIGSGNNGNGLGVNDIVVIVALLVGLSLIIGTISFVCFRKRKEKKKIMSSRSSRAEVEFVQKRKRKQNDPLLKEKESSSRRAYYS